MELNRTITSAEMRGINRTAVLDLVRREGPISRTEIASRLHISLTTVMRIVDELVEEELLTPTGDKEWSGGRRRPLIDFNGAGHLVIGIDMGGTKAYGALADLNGHILHEIDIPNHGSHGEESYQLLTRMISELREEADATGIHLLGIGIGVPGTVFAESGLVLDAAALKWKDFPLQERLTADFNLPAVVDNDVNLSALGEVWFGGHEDARNLVLITVGTGIGAGVILDGAIYRGTHQSAGEIGWLPPSPEYVGRKFVDFGPLERLASGPGIVERASKLLSGSGVQPGDLTTEDVFDAARRSEPWAGRIVDETVSLLGIAVAALHLCYDPGVIVLGGGVARSADLLVKPIVERLQVTMPFHPNLVASQLGYRAAVMGTIVNLLYRTSDFYVVRKLS